MLAVTITLQVDLLKTCNTHCLITGLIITSPPHAILLYSNEESFHER